MANAIAKLTSDNFMQFSLSRSGSVCLSCDHVRSHFHSVERHRNVNALMLAGCRRTEWNIVMANALMMCVWLPPVLNNKLLVYVNNAVNTQIGGTQSRLLIQFISRQKRWHRSLHSAICIVCVHHHWNPVWHSRAHIRVNRVTSVPSDTVDERNSRE